MHEGPGPWAHGTRVIFHLNTMCTVHKETLKPLRASHLFLARDVVYTSRAYAMMPVRLSVCDGSALAHYS